MFPLNKKPSNKKPSKFLLVLLLNSLADYDGHISADAEHLLEILRHRTDPIPPLYADVFGLPTASTCADLVQRVTALTPEQVAMASYAFQIFRSYEQSLQVDTTTMSPQQQAASASQLAQIRRLVARTKVALAEAMNSVDR